MPRAGGAGGGGGGGGGGAPGPARGGGGRARGGGGEHPPRGGGDARLVGLEKLGPHGSIHADRIADKQGLTVLPLRHSVPRQGGHTCSTDWSLCSRSR